MAKYRVGIIACGSIAGSHARGWRASEDVEIVAIADSHPHALQDFGDRWGIDHDKRYADYRVMLDEERLDIVSVASWHGQHAEMTIAAAARRPKVILTEKPMATNLGEADAMIVAGERNGVKLAVGHMRRFYSGWEQARQLVADGAIGQPERVWSVVLDGLLNWGTHTIDGMSFVLGDPGVTWVLGSVVRQTDRHERGLRIEDACVGRFQFANGTKAVIENDLSDYGSINFQIIGSEGVLDVDENTVRLMNAETRGWRTLDNPKNNPFEEQAKGIVDWLEGRVEDYRGEAKKARGTLEVMMALYESARRHEVTRLPLPTRANPLDLMVESGHLPVERPGKYDIRAKLVRGEGMSWL